MTRTASKQPLKDSMPMKAFRSLLRVVANHGYSVDEVLETIGLQYNPLLPEYQHLTDIPTRLYSKLYRQLMIMLQDEAFGMMTPDRAPPGTFRMMCLFIVHCRTLQQAIERYAEFLDYFDQFRSSTVRRRQPISELNDKGLARLRFDNPNMPAGTDNPASEASTLYMMYRLFSWFVGQNLPLHSVQLVGGDQRLISEYEPLFDAPIELNQPEYTLTLTKDSLAMPLVQTESTLHEFLRTAPYPLISRRKTLNAGEYQEKVKAIFAHELGSEIPSAQVIADHLNMSVRTLHRHLQKEGTSYQQLKDDFRKDAAITYMNRRELSINAIALLMGFQDSSAFHRSFKKWTGMSPGQYRQQLGTPS
ncbi:AraC family transcriptional regulator ligand-binding domain-containing protein [Litorivivens sp.]|uniref:AraC family transcriptional regulator n=3 Tax=Litorivivens sp. TaxID=2020868 RepID=UPI0035650F2C